MTLLGSVGDVAQVGGIALRRDAQGSRKAYVSDVVRHRIMVFDLDNWQSNLLAGDVMGNPGSTDGPFPGAAFRAPMGLAFLERNMNTSKMLLVADSGNARIRVVDTDTRIVSTWFAPLDRLAPEMTSPASITVAPSAANGLPMVYVVDSGKIGVVQHPVSSDTSIKVLSRVATTASGLTVVNAMPYGSPSTGVGNTVGFTQLIVQDSASRTVMALVQDQVALTTAAGGGSGSCHLACVNADCGPLQPAQLCGNSFLDPGEQCDDGGAPGGGCDPATCHFRQGYTCPRPLTACLEPCLAYTYAPTGAQYCTDDCSALAPPSGYTIDAHCALQNIDECSTGDAQCGPLALCTDTPGSYTCTCLSTYFGDGLTCASDAFAVYTLVDLQAYPSAMFQAALLSPATATGAVPLVLALLKETYARALTTFMPPGMLGYAQGFTMNTTQLARAFTSVSVDPTIKATTRLELVTLFATNAMAKAAAGGLSAQVLSMALSKAVFNSNTGVSVFQAPLTRSHAALGFSAPNQISGWGMNITGVSYNRTCVVSGATPTGGCWQVEMIYMGGPSMLKADQSQPDSAVLQSKNVLYLPRIDHDPTTMALLTPSQALTQNAGMYFPCSTSAASATGMGVTRPATACCLRDFQRLYRPNALLSGFLDSPSFARGVPASVCDAQATFNDTYPDSNIVFTLPEISGEHTNDLVVGHIEGMPHSEVRLLETIDYTTRTFRVVLVLEEGDLRLSASTMQGVLGSDYNLSFFVGLANFQGTGGSVMTTRNVQQYITVSKSNTLTLSTYGANQDPLVNAVDMQLIRIKVTDFFRPVQYLYYLQPLFTMPSTFSATSTGLGIVPLQSIRLIKSSSGTPSATDSRWMQACADPVSYIYANASLQTLVGRAQSQTCVQSYLQMCTPPVKANSLVSFGIPLPLDMITAQDLVASPPVSLTVEFVVDAFDSSAKSEVMTSLSLSVQVSALGLSAQCETQSAASTLADIITGNIYIGTATNDFEWDNTLQKKLNMDVPGATPSNSLQFHTTTVQGAVMTFSALGDPSYFEDQRALTQSVNINDIHTVNFLEPLGGVSGPTPSFDAVKALFLAGKAFAQKTDPKNHTSWLEPTPALLAICPLKPMAGRMVCITKVHSTIKNNVLSRSTSNVVELRPGDPTSVAEIQTLMGNVLLHGGSNGFTQMMGANFSAELIAKLGLNTRYRKAYVVNPVVDWSYQAIQSAQPGNTAFTLCSKIIAIGMITINTPSGTQLVRRLLSTVFDVPSSSSRALLQTEDMQPSATQTSNSMVLSLNVPGYDAVTQLCAGLLDVTYNRCVVLQFQSQVSGPIARDLCLQETQGILGTHLETTLHNAMMDADGISQIMGFFLLDYSIQGCPTSASGSRRLLAGSEAIVMLNKVLLSSSNGTVLLDTARLSALTTFLNSNSTWTSILGGGGFVYMVSVSTSPNGQLVSFNISVHNPEGKNASQIQGGLIDSLNGHGFGPSGGAVDVMFSSPDRSLHPSGGGGTGGTSAASALTVFAANILGALALVMVPLLQGP